MSYITVNVPKNSCFDCDYCLKMSNNQIYCGIFMCKLDSFNRCNPCKVNEELTEKVIKKGENL